MVTVDRALWLIKHDFIPSDVCEIFGFSEHSLQRWLANDDCTSYQMMQHPLMMSRIQLHSLLCYAGGGLAGGKH